MKNLYSLFFLILLPILVFASSSGKLSPRLKLFLDKYQKDTFVLKKGNTANQYVHIILQGNPEIIKSKISSEGGFVNTVAGDIVTAQVPVKSILNIAEESSIKRIDLPSKLKARNDEAIKRVNADKVHAGESPLNIGFTGKDVVVGIIDSGIDFRHPDFLNPNDPTKSRILFIWDQEDDSGTRPKGFSYGSEYTKEQIENEINGIQTGVVNQEDTDGHGTHVAGTAAGKNGLAPSSHIIVVKGMDNVVDASNYIFQKADELGLPAVINASLGTHFTSHDGSNAESIALDNMINSKSGRVFCAAAGNEGSDYIHLGGFDLNGGEIWTYYYGVEFTDENDGLILGMYGIVEDQYLSSLSLAIAVDSCALSSTKSGFLPVKLVDGSGWITINDIVQNQSVNTTLHYGNSEPAGEINISATSLNNGKTEFIIEIRDFAELGNDRIIFGKDYWRIYFNGHGSFHLWSDRVGTVPFPDELNITVDQNYVSPDNNFSVGDPATTKSVISVGSYASKNRWTDESGHTYHWDFTIGDISYFSSIGPTIDGRIKPEITAPGQMLISARSSSSDYNSGVYTYMQGTSMATPVVTGAIALYLEKYPDHSNEKIREVLFGTTIKDGFTNSLGSLPNNVWGYGKLDIFEAISQSISSVENNIEIPNTFIVYQNYPNPFNPTTILKYSLPKSANVKVSIYNIVGQEISVLVNQFENAGKKEITWNSTNYLGAKVASGIYFFKFNFNGNGFNTQTIKKGLLLK